MPSPCHVGWFTGSVQIRALWAEQHILLFLVCVAGFRFLRIQWCSFRLTIFNGTIIGLVTLVPRLLFSRAQEGVAEDLDDVEADRHEEDDTPGSDCLL